MKDLIRSRPVLGMATLLLVAALAISFAATGIRSTYADSPPSFSGPVHPNPQGGLDCNGYSATGQKTFRNFQVCADLNSLECITDLGCNPSCTEPVNFAFLETNGVPPGPPGPSAQTSATFSPDANTLLMNQGDVLNVTLFDTANGLETFINDLTMHQSGFMVASADNGFTNTNPLTCAPTPFNFHPEYSTARFGNAVPWAALQANVGFAIEAGHFETGSGDGDTDDQPCFPTSPISILPGCIDQANGDGDLDFDGTSYQPDWPDGTHNNATSLLFTSPLSAANGSSSYHDMYPIMQIETDVPASESTCISSGIGCTVPPTGASFYPFYNIARGGGGNFDSEALGGCFFLFGNKMQGGNDLGQDAQYGTPDLPWFFGTSSSGPQANPCLSLY